MKTHHLQVPSSDALGRTTTQVRNMHEKAKSCYFFQGLCNSGSNNAIPLDGRSASAPKWISIVDVEGGAYSLPKIVCHVGKKRGVDVGLLYGHLINASDSREFERNGNLLTA